MRLAGTREDDRHSVSGAHVANGAEAGAERRRIRPASARSAPTGRVTGSTSICRAARTIASQGDVMSCRPTMLWKVYGSCVLLVLGVAVLMRLGLGAFKPGWPDPSRDARVEVAA